MATVLSVNGETRQVEADPQKPLLWVLREDLDLLGTKFGCGMALCGACTVMLDGQAVRSCTTPVSSATGKQITTIEHVASTQAGRKISEAWVELDVPQCGYCQAGQIVSATALLDKTPQPSDAQIDAAMTGNICRCATYLRIRSAIKKAAGIEEGTAA